jgi:hypothetical protein
MSRRLPGDRMGGPDFFCTRSSSFFCKGQAVACRHFELRVVFSSNGIPRRPKGGNMKAIGMLLIAFALLVPTDTSAQGSRSCKEGPVTE